MCEGGKVEVGDARGEVGLGGREGWAGVRRPDCPTGSWYTAMAYNSAEAANDAEGLAALRHSASHVMAQAIKRLYPSTKLAIGPSIADGFYYDLDPETPFTADDMEGHSECKHKLGG